MLTLGIAFAGPLFYFVLTQTSLLSDTSQFEFPKYFIPVFSAELFSTHVRMNLPSPDFLRLGSTQLAGRPTASLSVHSYVDYFVPASQRPPGFCYS